ncbi:MAG: helix-turn-helix transcriptional regulator [Tissierellia bacterium]|nr:helix-turn-helix transcriptional regulator [Tissierellia bacterium]
MKVSYRGLWKTLVQREMYKKDLIEALNLSPATMAKMGRGEFVSMGVLYRIGKLLDLDIGDMVSIVKEEDETDFEHQKYDPEKQ